MKPPVPMSKKSCPVALQVEIDTVIVPVSASAKFALSVTEVFALYIELCIPVPIGVALILLTSTNSIVAKVPLST